MIRFKFISPGNPRLRAKSGVTITELIMVVAIIGIITPMVLSLLVTIMRGFTGYEAASQMRKTNQETLNRIYLRLGSSKRLYEYTAVTANNMLTRISLTGFPSLLTGSKLPVIAETGVLNTDTTGFMAAIVGNSLFFANNDSSMVLVNTSTIRVDLFRFNYYYLTPDNTHSIYDKESYLITEWRSVQYADYRELISITTAAVRACAVTELFNKGIIYAWDTTAIDNNSAFYTMNNAGVISAATDHMIQNYKCANLTNMITGIVMGGYKYGVSANSAGWAKAPKVVPHYATQSLKFPGGFEVVVVGNSAGRQVLVRNVLVAQGSMPSILGDDMMIITSVRDVW
jgi:type II secretory pathway pseudopilin PulG